VRRRRHDLDHALSEWTCQQALQKIPRPGQAERLRATVERLALIVPNPSYLDPPPAPLPTIHEIYDRLIGHAPIPVTELAGCLGISRSLLHERRQDDPELDRLCRTLIHRPGRAGIFGADRRPSLLPRQTHNHFEGASA